MADSHSSRAQQRAGATRSGNDAADSQPPADHAHPGGDSGDASLTPPSLALFNNLQRMTNESYTAFEPHVFLSSLFSGSQPADQGLSDSASSEGPFSDTDQPLIPFDSSSTASGSGGESNDMDEILDAEYDVDYSDRDVVMSGSDDSDHPNAQDTFDPVVPGDLGPLAPSALVHQPSDRDSTDAESDGREYPTFTMTLEDPDPDVTATLGLAAVQDGARVRFREPGSLYHANTSMNDFMLHPELHLASFNGASRARGQMASGSTTSVTTTDGPVSAGTAITERPSPTASNQTDGPLPSLPGRRTVMSSWSRDSPRPQSTFSFSDTHDPTSPETQEMDAYLDIFMRNFHTRVALERANAAMQPAGEQPHPASFSQHPLGSRRRGAEPRGRRTSRSRARRQAPFSTSPLDPLLAEQILRDRLQSPMSGIPDPRSLQASRFNLPAINATAAASASLGARDRLRTLRRGSTLSSSAAAVSANDMDFAAPSGSRSRSRSREMPWPRQPQRQQDLHELVHKLPSALMKRHPPPVLSPTPECSFLRPGVRFRGHQTIQQRSLTTHTRLQRWDVFVTLDRVDLARGKVEGTMVGLNMPARVSNVTTYWEGEILDFKTCGLCTGKWSSDSNTDRQFWQNFKGLKRLRTLKSRDALESISPEIIADIQQDYILMRWKEHFFVNVSSTDHDLSISGFYYICMRRSDGVITGFYRDMRSKPYQKLKLRPEASKSGLTFPTYSMC